jgi:hypothetical protein
MGVAEIFLEGLLAQLRWSATPPVEERGRQELRWTERERGSDGGIASPVVEELAGGEKVSAGGRERD